MQLFLLALGEENDDSFYCLKPTWSNRWPASIVDFKLPAFQGPSLAGWAFVHSPGKVPEASLPFKHQLGVEQDVLSAAVPGGGFQHWRIPESVLAFAFRITKQKFAAVRNKTNWALVLPDPTWNPWLYFGLRKEGHCKSSAFLGHCS